MIKNETYPVRCASHECTECGRKLQVRATSKEWMLMFGVSFCMSMVIIVSTFWEKRLDARPSCSVREYIEGHGTDREVMKTHDVKCEDVL